MDKPASIAASEFKSAKWDEITAGRNFSQTDAPTLALLCQWYEVVEKCMDDLEIGNGIQVAYQNDMGDLKALPQLSTMKQASAEIRALNKQLGIDDAPKETTKKKEASIIAFAMNDRAKKAKRASA